MTTDYDAPRVGTPDVAIDGVEDLPARRAKTNTAVVDVDDTVDVFDPPSADIFDEELTVAVIPIQGDEFRCSRCFLVHHRHRRTQSSDLICVDCA